MVAPVPEGVQSPAVAEDVVRIGLGGAVVRLGQAVEVVVQVAPGLGDAVDDLGLAASPSLAVEGVEVAGQNCRVEEVLALFEPAVLEPALRGALARVQALLDQPPAGIVGEAHGLAVGGDDARQPSGGVVAQARLVAVAVGDHGQAPARRPGVAQRLVAPGIGDRVEPLGGVVGITVGDDFQTLPF